MSKTVFLLLLLGPLGAGAQNSVGLISIDQGKTTGGYNLIYPENQPNVFLLNECGELVHSWTDANNTRPGKTAYLLENGNLLKSKTSGNIIGSFGAGGTGGLVEIYSWENDLLWSYQVADSLNRQHHDVHFMENGHVLMIVWERKSFDEIIEKGFDTLNNTQEELWPDYILEINPENDERVWEWHAWDHLIQDFDSTKLNYGEVSAHPGLIDLNYQKLSGQRADFMHTNAIDYDPVKDQVILSVRNYNEIWIIDHSTTTAEAAGHTGGNSGKGGDLLFRWGNPEAYKMGQPEDRKLFLQHDVQWIDNLVDSNYEHFGKIVLYNNFLGSNLSLGQILEPQWDDLSKSFAMDNGVFLPEGFTSTISHPDTSKNFSGTGSSIQIIENGHVLMCASIRGFIFELTPDGEVVWEYKVPLRNGFPVPQGFELSPLDNYTFRCQRYPSDYAGLAGKDLSAKGYLELEPNDVFCQLTAAKENAKNDPGLKIYPNPFSQYLTIETARNDGHFVEIFNHYGQLYFYANMPGNKLQLNTADWPKGIYLVKIEGVVVRKIILQ